MEWNRGVHSTILHKDISVSCIQPLYGHTTEPPPFMYIHENGLFSVEDREVLLQDTSLSSPVAPSGLPPAPSLSGQPLLGVLHMHQCVCPGRWLMLEGVPVEPQGME